MRLIMLKDKVSEQIVPDEFYVVNDMTARQWQDLVGRNPEKYMVADFYSYYKKYEGEDLNGKTLYALRNGGAGDILFLSVAIKHLKKKYPEAIVHVYCAERYHGVIEGNPYIDVIGSAPLLLKEWEAADYHIIFEGIIEGSEKASQMNAYDLFLERLFIDHEPIPAEEKLPYVHVDKELQEKLIEDNVFLSNGKKTLVIHMRASSPIRTPDQKKQVEVASYFKDTGWNVVMASSAREAVSIKNDLRFFRVNPDDYYFSADICPTWQQVIALIDLCDLAVVPDSSIGHLAGALKKPTVAIYGPFPSDLRMRYYTNVRALDVKPPCAPCFLGNQEIMVEKNIVKPISHIDISTDKVLTDQGRFMPVTDVMRRDVKDEDIVVLNIKGISEPLKATEDHPVLCTYDHPHAGMEPIIGYLPIKTIKSMINDNKDVYINYFDYNVYVNLVNLLISKTLTDKDTRSLDSEDIIYDEKDKTIHTVFDKSKGIRIDNKLSLTPELLKFFGIFVSSGRIGIMAEEKGTKSRFIVDIAAKNDQAKDEISAITKYLFDLDDSVIKFKYNADGKIIILIECDILARFLQRLFGAKQPYRDKIIPRWFFGLDERNIASFLAGFKINNDEEPFTVRSRNKRYIYSIAIMMRAINEFADITGEPNFNYKLTSVNKQIDVRSIGDKKFLKVESCSVKKHTGTVYNLEVQGDESYIAKTWTVHNCFTHGHEPCIMGLPSPCFQLYESMHVIDAASDLVDVTNPDKE